MFPTVDPGMYLSWRIYIERLEFLVLNENFLWSKEKARSLRC